MFVKYVRNQARVERDVDGNEVPPEKQIVVFPGIEVTLNVPCQALVIFDADFPDDLFSLVLTALASTPSKPSDPKTTETKRLDHVTTLEKLREELDKHDYLKNKYIILPNVSDGGEHTLLRTAMHQSIRLCRAWADMLTVQSANSAKAATSGLRCSRHPTTNHADAVRPIP
jgi:type III restriction enzyme